MTERQFESSIETEFKGRLDYKGYLDLDRLLAAQRPLSDPEHHDEMLFIIQHQTSELWMKLAIHELKAACAAIAADDLQPAFKMLARVARIMEQLNSAWDVLRTMTPSEYTQFRSALGSSSGFQSWQYRAIEFLVGNKNEAMLRLYEDRPDIQIWLDELRRKPSLYDESISALARKGMDVAIEVTARDKTMPYASHPSVRAAWAEIYRQPAKYWELYELAEKLVDFEDYFRRWRFNHVTTVERVIGLKRGTGGTSGVTYLRRMLGVVLFPELWEVRTEL